MCCVYANHGNMCGVSSDNDGRIAFKKKVTSTPSTGAGQPYIFIETQCLYDSIPVLAISSESVQKE